MRDPLSSITHFSKSNSESRAHRKTTETNKNEIDFARAKILIGHIFQIKERAIFKVTLFKNSESLLITK